MKHKGRIFILDDDELILSMLSKVLKKDGYEVQAESTPHDVMKKIKSYAPDVILLDINLPERSGMEVLEEIVSKDFDVQVIMLTADDTAETAVKAMKLGAFDYLTKPFNKDEVKIIIANAIEKKSLKQEVTYLRKAYDEKFERNLIGESPVMKELVSNMEKMAEAGVSTILITGESGTGKEVVARNIHRLMHGSAGPKYAPFIWINCAAMPESILESELFGYEKGAFTDAKSDKKGLFELADGGTILLDEIGDMRTGLQSKLLRVLEERTIRRIGGKDDKPIDLTVLATTNRNLQEAVSTGEFRQDLFFRLSTFYIHVQPLRKRKEDIPLLASHFLLHFATKYNKKNIKEFSPEAEKILMSYSWPGNIRELRNLIERLVVLENIEVIMPEQLPKWIYEKKPDEKAPAASSDGRFILPDSGISLEDLEKDLIMQAIERTGNNKAEAARLLNVSYDTLRYQIKKFGLE